MVVKAMGAGELLTLDRKVFLTSWPNCDISLGLIRGKFAKNMEKLDDCRRNGHAAIIGKAAYGWIGQEYVLAGFGGMGRNGGRVPPVY